MSNITNYLNKVKTAIYGKEVRGAIHDAIKQVYDDASVEHDNANMEVKLARGTHNTLNDRLDNVDEIQAQTNAQLLRKANNDEVVKRGFGTLNDFDEETRRIIQGLDTGSINAVLGIGNVTNENLADKCVDESKFLYLKTGKNLYNYNRRVVGQIVDHTKGTLTANSEYDTSNYIRIYKDIPVTINRCRKIAIYDLNKKCTGGFDLSNVTHTFTPDSDGYIRASFRNVVGTDYSAIAQVEYNDMSTTYEQYQLTFEDDIFIPVKDSNVAEPLTKKSIAYGSITPKHCAFLEIGKNIYNKEEDLLGYYVGVNGAEVEAQGYRASEYIKIQANTDYFINKSRKLCVYDDKKNVIQQCSVDNVNNSELIVNIPFDGYIRISTKDEYCDIVQVEKGNAASSYEPFHYKLEGIIWTNGYDNSNLLAGKSIANFGDSIADGVSADFKGYAHRIAERNGMELYDYASGGATIKVTDGVDNNILEQVNKATSESLDYVLFNGYTNDAKSSTNAYDEEYIGVVTEGFENEYNELTFCGAFEKIIATLRNKYPNAKVIYVGTHINSARNLKAQKIFNDLALKICKKWGIPVVNMFEEGGLNSFLPTHKSEYINDGSHPNGLGYDVWYVPLIENKMKGM